MNRAAYLGRPIEYSVFLWSQSNARLLFETMITFITITKTITIIIISFHDNQEVP